MNDPAPPPPRSGGWLLWPILTIPAAGYCFIVGLARGMQTAPSSNDFFIGWVAQWLFIGLLLFGFVALFVRRLRIACGIATIAGVAGMFAADTLYP